MQNTPLSTPAARVVALRTIVVHSNHPPVNETSRLDPSMLAAAYLLASFSVFGLAGLHRFYLGKPITGAIWMMTWGLLGFGTLYDLITMNLQVEQSLANKRIALPPATVSDPAPALETQILRLAHRHRGKLNALEVAAELGIPVVQAERALDELATTSHVNIEVGDDGVVRYDFPALRPTLETR